MPETEGEKIQRQVAAIRSQGGTDKDVEAFLSAQPSVKTESGAVSSQPQASDREPGHRSGNRRGEIITEAPDVETAGDRAAGLIREGYQGLTLGAGNKIIAGVRSVLPEKIGGTHGFDFSGALKEENQGREDFERLHPVASRVAEIAGGVPTMLATGGGAALGELELATAAGKLAKIGYQGAKYGAISGALGSDKVADVPENTISGSGKGLAAALLLHGGGKLLGYGATSLGIPQAASTAITAASSRIPTGRFRDGLERLAGSVGREGQASTAIAQRLASEGKTPESVAREVSQNTYGNPTTTLSAGGSGQKPEILADYSPEVGKLTKAVTKQPGPGRAAINKTLSDRQALTRERVTSDLTQGTAPDPFKQHLEQLVGARDKSAAKLFPAAYKAGAEGVDDPAVTEILERPTFQKAYKMAKTMAADDGTPLPAKEVIPPPPHPGMNQAKWEEAARNGGLVKEVPIPDVRTIHYVNRAVRRMIDGGFEGASPIVDPQHALALESTLNELRGVVGKKVPEFEAAMQDFSEKSKPIDALKTGQDVLKYIGGERVAPQAMGKGVSLAMKPANRGIDGLEQAVHNMAPSERELFRHAALGRVVQQINKVPSTVSGSTAPVLRRIFADTPEAKRWQRLLFNSTAEAETFQRALSRERNMVATNARMSGSDTAENIAEGDALNPTLGIGTLLTHPFAAAKAGFGAAQKAGQKQLYGALGQRLSSTKLQDVLEHVAKEQLMREGMGNLGSAVRNSAAARLARHL